LEQIFQDHSKDTLELIKLLDSINFIEGNTIKDFYQSKPFYIKVLEKFGLKKRIIRIPEKSPKNLFSKHERYKKYNVLIDLIIKCKNTVDLETCLSETIGVQDNKLKWLNEFKEFLTIRIDSKKGYISRLISKHSESHIFLLQSAERGLSVLEYCICWIDEKIIELETLKDIPQPIETEPGNISAKHEVQKILLLIEFGFVEHLETKYNLGKNQCFKVLGTLTDVNWTTIQRCYNAYIQGKLNPSLDNKNNPDNDNNRTWLNILLNTYKINKH